MPLSRISRAVPAGAAQRAANGTADQGRGKSAVEIRTGADRGTKAGRLSCRWAAAGRKTPAAAAEKRSSQRRVCALISRAGTAYGSYRGYGLPSALDRVTVTFRSSFGKAGKRRAHLAFHGGALHAAPLPIERSRKPGEKQAAAQGKRSAATTRWPWRKLRRALRKAVPARRPAGAGRSARPRRRWPPNRLAALCRGRARNRRC